jgi:hypothetical protein
MYIRSHVAIIGDQCTLPGDHLRCQFVGGQEWVIFECHSFHVGLIETFEDRNNF